MSKKAVLSVTLLFQVLFYSNLSKAEIQQIYVNPEWSAIASGLDPDGYGPATQMGVDSFSDIQSAVDVAAPGAEIRLTEATYVGQIKINKPLSLIGMGSSTIIQFEAQNPRVEFNTGVNNVPVILVENSSGVKIKDLAIDGRDNGNENSRFMGIAFYRASGVIDEVRISNIQNSPQDGSQHGIGIYVRNNSNIPQSISITRSSVTQYQKAGIVVVGDYLSAVIKSNTVEGSGDNPVIAQNGIQVGFGASAEITNNRVTDNNCVSAACLGDAVEASADMASGILLYHAAGLNIVRANEVQGNQCGVCSVGTTRLELRNNDIVNGSAVAVNLMEADTYSAAFGYSPEESYTLLRNNRIFGHDYGVIAYDFFEGAPSPQVQLINNQISGQNVCSYWTNVGEEVCQSF